MKFPEGFLFGAATSAIQYEGSALVDGKGLSVNDIRFKEHGIETPEESLCSDGYHRYKEDIALMKELGLKSYRFSISWSRICPDGDGDFNPKGIQYYHDVIDTLVENGIEPVITLFHFDLPYGLVEKYDGFVDRRCIDAFDRYCRKCFLEYGDKVHYWLTINEQNVMVMIPEMLGIKEDTDRKCAISNYHMFLASAKAIASCHEMLPNAKIGPCVSYPTLYPETCNPKDVRLAYEGENAMAYDPMEVYVYGYIPNTMLKKWEKVGFVPDNLKNDLSILKAGKPDYLGLNWYCTQTIGTNNEKATLNFGPASMIENPYLEYGKWGWSYDPTALKMALQECHYRFRLPLMICENGWSQLDKVEDGCVHDPKRTSYIHDHMVSMLEAIESGVDLIGYQYWSFTDIQSSSQGFEKRYGLVYVDQNTMERIKKDSFYWYKETIQNEGSNL